MASRTTNGNYANSGFETPKSQKAFQDDDFFSEKTRKLALFTLIFSFLVLIGKVGSVYYEFLEKAILERKLVSYEVLSEDGRVMLVSSWETAVRYSHFWLPLVCGLLTTYATWMFVYLDSNVPGIQPPSPLSPHKYRIQSGHTFHLNYVFAILIGVLVTSTMYYKGASIQY